MSHARQWTSILSVIRRIPSVDARKTTNLVSSQASTNDFSVSWVRDVIASLCLGHHEYSFILIPDDLSMTPGGTMFSIDQWLTPATLVGAAGIAVAIMCGFLLARKYPRYDVRTGGGRNASSIDSRKDSRYKNRDSM